VFSVLSEIEIRLKRFTQKHHQTYWIRQTEASQRDRQTYRKTGQ